MPKYNSQSFLPSEKDLAKKLIDYFFQYNEKSTDHYIDFHVTTDGLCTIIEWIDVPYTHEWGGAFQFVGFEEQVCHRLEFPDGTSIRIGDEEWEEKEAIIDFLNEHPEWDYDPYLRGWNRKFPEDEEE